MTIRVRKQTALRYCVVAATAALIQYSAAYAQTSAEDAPASPASVQTQQLQSVEVQAHRPADATGSHAEALQLKKEAPNIIQVQPLSEIRKLPDVNTAEALQRLPGISLETDSGEGRFINIRGLDAALNGTTFGNVRLPTTNPASNFGQGRAVALDTVPTGLVGGLVLTETNRPDQDAEALGGTIELVPRNGASHGGKPFLEMHLGGGDKPLHSTPLYDFNATAGSSFGLFGGDGWFSGPDAFSALLTVAYYDEQLGVDDLEADYSDQQSAGVPDKLFADTDQRYYNYHRKRYGVGGELDARGNENNNFYLRFLVSGYLEAKHAWHLGLDSLDSGCDTTSTPADCSGATDPSNPNGFVAPAAQPSHALEDNLERIQTNLGELGGKSKIGIVTFDYHAAYAEGIDRVPFAFGTSFVDPNTVNLAYDNTSDPRFPSFTPLDGTNLANPANYTLDQIAKTTSSDRDRILSQALNASIPLQLISMADELKFGVQLRERKHSHHQSEIDAAPINPIGLNQLHLSGPTVYYADHYDIGGIPNQYQLRSIFQNPALVTYSSNPAADAANTQSADENVYAAYFQYSTTILEKLGVLAGLRVEATDATYRGNVYNPDSNTNTPASQSNSYTNVFPTVQLRYPLLKTLIARFSYSSAIGRPGFDQVSPGAVVVGGPRHVGGATATVGNPKLKPTTGDNYDLSLAWYPAPDAIASVDFFDKEFSNYVLPSVNIVNNFPNPLLAGEVVTVTTNNNGKARADGVEVNLSDKFSFLPEPLDGLGASANLTLVHSSSSVANSLFSGRLPSTSPVSWNAAVFYEKGPAQIRVAADYVSQNLFGFGNTPDQNIYSRRRLTLDFAAQYQVRKSIAVFFAAKNLLDTPLEFTEGKSDSRPIQREFYDATITGGVNLTFE